jgi:hypothetical protein
MGVVGIVKLSRPRDKLDSPDIGIAGDVGLHLSVYGNHPIII